jgi:hypothetical protein
MQQGQQNGGPGGPNGPNGPQEDTLILFFHEQSNACNKLKEIIPKDKKIQYVNIAYANNIPPSVQSVPALVINNKDLLTGKKVFDYFQKSDEMEFFSFSGKNSGFSNFSTIGDSDNVDSNSMFSSIDASSMADGVPKWDESEESKSIDIDSLQSQRSILIKEQEQQQQQQQQQQPQQLPTRR